MTGLVFYWLGSCPIMPHLLQKCLLLSGVYLKLWPCSIKAITNWEYTFLTNTTTFIVIENLENRDLQPFPVMGFSNEHYKNLWVRSQLLSTVTGEQKQSQVMTICKWVYLWLCSNHTLYQRTRFDLQSVLLQFLEYKIQSNFDFTTEIWTFFCPYVHIILHCCNYTVSSQLWPHFGDYYIVYFENVWQLIHTRSYN